MDSFPIGQEILCSVGSRTRRLARGGGQRKRSQCEVAEESVEAPWLGRWVSGVGLFFDVMLSLWLAGVLRTDRICENRELYCFLVWESTDNLTCPTASRELAIGLLSNPTVLMGTFGGTGPERTPRMKGEASGGFLKNGSIREGKMCCHESTWL